jgi:hypothetical protein
MTETLAGDPARKDLVGDALLIEEVKYLWGTIVNDKKDETVKNMIVKAYASAKAKQETVAKTPVVKED